MSSLSTAAYFPFARVKVTRQTVHLEAQPPGAPIGLQENLGAFAFLSRQPFLGEQLFQLDPFLLGESDNIAFGHWCFSML